MAKHHSSHHGSHSHCEKSSGPSGLDYLPYAIGTGIVLNKMEKMQEETAAEIANLEWQLRDLAEAKTPTPSVGRYCSPDIANTEEGRCYGAFISSKSREYNEKQRDIKTAKRLIQSAFNPPEEDSWAAKSAWRDQNPYGWDYCTVDPWDYPTQAAYDRAVELEHRLGREL